MMRPSETDKLLRKKERRVRIQVDEDFRSTEADDKNRFEDSKIEERRQESPKKKQEYHTQPASRN